MLNATSRRIEELFARPGQMPACMVVQAHPDDEVIGLGAQLPNMRHAILVHVTDGAPRDGLDASVNGFGGAYEYAIARRKELEAAIALAGIPSEQLEEIACPDQQAPLYMAEIARKLLVLIAQHRPQVLFTHPYEGGHPDHDATAFAAHAACQLLARAGEPVPWLIEISAYHNGPQGLTPYSFLPPNSGDDSDGEVTFTLDAEQQELKRRMFAQFRTQQGTLQYFPLEKECLRNAPRYRFTQPPHYGRLFYEMYPWGMTGSHFNSLSQSAQDALGLEEVF